ncbi:insulin-like growth factor 2a [Trichomycterus rosablanca]|uniref:insulin-like growth factor 2a n=1 Tax=Trichomycterus rosablanca TaxID=2290929 RepID=UPI002F360D43
MQKQQQRCGQYIYTGATLTYCSTEEMEPRPLRSHHPASTSTSSCTTIKRYTTSTMTSTCRLLLFTVALSLYSSQVSAETLCGGELVDTLQFVCGDRGFYFSRPYRSNGRRPNRGIVEECCFRSCDLRLLEQYCAKPAKSERDISATTLQVVPVLQTLHKDGSRKPLNVRPPRYELWQRTAAQRLRRGIHAILRHRNSKRPSETIPHHRDQERSDFHRPLMPVSSRSPPTIMSRIQSLAVHK